MAEEKFQFRRRQDGRYEFGKTVEAEMESYQRSSYVSFASLAEAHREYHAALTAKHDLSQRKLRTQSDLDDLLRAAWEELGLRGDAPVAVRTSRGLDGCNWDVAPHTAPQPQDALENIRAALRTSYNLA